MYAIIVHHMDDVGLMEKDGLVNDAKFLFFCNMMDEGYFSPLQIICLIKRLAPFNN